MKIKPELLDPVGQVVKYVDPRTDQRFSKQLQDAQARQMERDMMADAYIDEAFHGVPYTSIFEEFPFLAEIKEAIESKKKKPA